MGHSSVGKLMIPQVSFSWKQYALDTSTYILARSWEGMRYSRLCSRHDDKYINTIRNKNPSETRHESRDCIRTCNSTCSPLSIEEIISRSLRVTPTAWLGLVLFEISISEGIPTQLMNSRTLPCLHLSTHKNRLHTEGVLCDCLWKSL